MTHLLGRQDCVDSLRRDLIDLQGAVLDVFSRTGPVRCPSWKFPDKQSCNLDLVLLLETYDFVEGEEEFNQHTHIVLLELVIDRLMLLLQSFSAHIDLILGGKRKTPGPNQTAPSVSIGPVVKNFWSNLVQLGKQFPRQSVFKTSPADRGAQSLHSTSSLQNGVSVSAQSSVSVSARPSSQHLLSGAAHSTSSQHLRPRAAPGAIASSSSLLRQSLPHLLSSSSSPHLLSQSGVSSPCPPPAPPGAPSNPSISCDSHSVGVQTCESSLVACDACAGVQAALCECGAALVSVCGALGLPSSLQRLLLVAQDAALAGRLSSSDVVQWAAEQRRDLERLANHQRESSAAMDTLREQQRTAEKERGALRTQVDRERRERRRTEEERRRQEEERERGIKEERRKGEEEVKRLQEELEELRRGVVSMECKNKELNSDLSLQREALHTLESEREALQEEVRRLQTQEVTWAQAEERRRDLEAELSNLRLLLDKECVKYQSATRQHESLQMKQRALLERVDSLVSECDELQTRLEEKEELTHTLTHTSEERDTLQQQLTTQQAECVLLQQECVCVAARVCELESSVGELKEELQRAAHRERMLVAFPELTPIHHQGAPQSTGDVLGDMEQQLQVNRLRIRVLEQENVTLTSSLDKLRTAGKTRAHQHTQQHTQMWSLQHMNESDPPQHDPSRHVQQTHPAAHSAPAVRRSQVEVRWRAEEDMCPWERPPPLSLHLLSPSSLSSSSSPPPILHQHLLQLPLPPQPCDAELTFAKTCQNARAHARSRSAGGRHKRK